MGEIWKEIWKLFNTELHLPYIGTWSILEIEVFLSLLYFLVWFVGKMIGAEEE